MRVSDLPTSSTAPSPGETLAEADIVRLFAGARRRVPRWCATPPTGCAAQVSGDTVTYVVTRNINYTNICYFRCQFCAFSKGKLSENLRGRPYNLDMDEIVRRSEEAWERGATEVCLQGGIHPEYTGATYLAVCRAIKQALPGMHVHAFSPLEVWQGAKTLGRTLPDFLAELRDAGLGSLPGTAAEILDDEVRAVICPDKVKTAEWLAGHGGGASASGCAARSRSCSAMSTATSIGRAICCGCAPCSSGPAALPNSCRCRSCRWRRRSR